VRHLANRPDTPTARVGSPATGVRRTASRWPALLAFVSALCWTMLAGAPAASAAMTVIPSGATAVSASNEYDCALIEDGTARCWGRNNGSGQFGDGTTSWTWNPNPVTVSGLGNAIGISAGWSHACALLEDGTARCWGWNGPGALGDGTNAASTTPVAVSGLSGAVAISAGSNHTCALLEDGTARCWGQNGLGELGNGTKTDSTTPVAVSGLSGAVAISAGVSHTCALLEDGTARCWGWNGTGELGNGTKTDSTTPVAVSGLSGAVAISAFGGHTCALLEDGAAMCWGWGGSGELGGVAPAGVGGEFVESLTPVPVFGLNDATVISAGHRHTCTITAGAVECWGYDYGPREVPAESPTSAPTPAQTPTTLLTPPKARITSHPPKETASQSAPFAFTGVPGGTYECSVDAGPWRRCRSGEDFGSLPPGDHRFRVRETLNGLTGPADSYSWTIDLPRACVLRVARARVFVYARRKRVRLVIRYKTYRPAKVTVAYRLLGGRGQLALGGASSHFKTAGLFRLAERLGEPEMRKVRAARLFKLKFRIPGTPGSCARYYTKRLTIPKRYGGRKVWFQSDSIFGVGWGG
jgi:Regulator of chromosome condensation (RCC1) repeat